MGVSWRGEWLGGNHLCISRKYSFFAWPSFPLFFPLPKRASAIPSKHFVDVGGVSGMDAFKWTLQPPLGCHALEQFPRRPCRYLTFSPPKKQRVMAEGREGERGTQR